MTTLLLGYVALSLPVTAHWYVTRLYRLALRAVRLLAKVKNQAASAVRRRLRRFLSEDGGGSGMEAG